jgi:hypothetical protein
MTELLSGVERAPDSYHLDYASFRSELDDIDRGFEFLLVTLAAFWRSVSFPMSFTPSEARHVLAAVDYAEYIKIEAKTQALDFMVDDSSPLSRRMPAVSDLREIRAKFADTNITDDHVKVILTRWDVEQIYWALRIANRHHPDVAPYGSTDFELEVAMLDHEDAMNLLYRIEEQRPWIEEPLAGASIHYLADCLKSGQTKRRY